MQPIYRYEMNYFNASGYWLGLQKTCFAMVDLVAIEEVTVESRGRMARLLAWAGILGEYAIRVLAVRQEFYRNSVKDPVSARLNQEMYEEDAYLPASDALDDRTKQLENLRETQLMKPSLPSPPTTMSGAQGGRRPTSDDGPILAGPATES